MKANIIQIGNEQGIFLPKTLLEECGFKDSVEITLRENGLFIQASPKRKPREGWKESFKKMAESGDDLLLDQDNAPSRWDQEEWNWD